MSESLRVYVERELSHVSERLSVIENLRGNNNLSDISFAEREFLSRTVASMREYHFCLWSLNQICNSVGKRG